MSPETAAATLRPRMRAALLGVLVVALSTGSWASGSGASPKPMHTAGATATTAQAADPHVRVHVFYGRSSQRCDAVVAVDRLVRPPRLLYGTMAALLRGPTNRERHAGLFSWFSAKTAGMLRSARISSGVAYVDFRDFSRIIPNASTSCGSAALLAQLDRTAKQFSTVQRTIYSFNGSRTAFYRWLQLDQPPA